ncbi:hypothetical protein CWC15_09900 [Pseudoalteromonas spongiae]|nr:hypothetical protein CWC15_09900 [Pseudoalteromonas spongiae]
MALADIIKSYRIKRNFKQDDVAEMVGVTVQTYSKWENGKTEPKASQLVKLANVLYCTTDALLHENEASTLNGMLSSICTRAKNLRAREKAILIDLMEAFCFRSETELYFGEHKNEYEIPEPDPDKIQMIESHLEEIDEIKDSELSLMARKDI